MAATDVVQPMVCETCSTNGTGTFTLTGAVSGFRTFLNAYGAGDGRWYCARSSSGTKWEIGYGTVSGATLTRTVIVSSAGAATAEDFTGATPFRVYSDQASALLNSAIRWHFNTSRPAHLPANSIWTKDAGSNVVEFYYFDGTDDILLPFSVNTSTNAVAFSVASGSITVTKTDNGAAGATIVTYHNSASPAGGDNLGGWQMDGNSSTGVRRTYASHFAVIVDPTNGSEDAVQDFYVMRAGTLSLIARLGGAGTPEGAITASPGAIYTRADGGAGTCLYVKESGTETNTGWVAK